MRLSTTATAMAAGLLWGSAVLVVGLVNLAVPAYGLSFLQMVSSVYPGFDLSRTIGDVLTGTFYGILDGGLAGLIFGWPYNLFSDQSHSRHAREMLPFDVPQLCQARCSPAPPGKTA